MYTWQVVGRDPAEGALRAGAGDSLASIMRLIEGYLAPDGGFVGHIVETEPQLSVGQLEPVHVPTGREWVGLRDRSGACRWGARFRPSDCDFTYPVSAADGPGPPTAGPHVRS